MYVFTIYASIIMHMTCNTISLIVTFLSKEGVEGAAKGAEKGQILQSQTLKITNHVIGC